MVTGAAKQERRTRTHFTYWDGELEDDLKMMDSPVENWEAPAVKGDGREPWNLELNHEGARSVGGSERIL